MYKDIEVIIDPNPAIFIYPFDPHLMKSAPVSADKTTAP